MRANAGTLALAGAAAALAPPAAAVVLLWLGAPPLLPSGPYEFFILEFVIARALVYCLVPRLSRLGTAATILFFTGDFLLLPVSTAAGAVTGSQAYLGLANSYLPTWLSCTTIVYPSLVAFLVARGFQRKTRVAYALPAAAVSYVTSASVISAFGAAGSGTGLAGFWRLVDGVRTPQPQGWPSELATVCGAVLFASLVGYALAAGQAREGGTGPGLSLAVLGASLLLVVVALAQSQPVWVALGAPTAAMAASLWVVTRGT